jgi:hypothetical protein
MAIAKSLKYAAAVLAFAAAGAANAATGYCINPAPVNTDGLSTSDVNYSVTGAVPFTNATDCYGVVSGNITGTDLGVTNTLRWGTGFVYGDGTDSGSGTVNLFGGSFTFTLTATAGTTGTYTLTATDNNGATPPNYPIFLDFVVGLKASDRYALYFFDDATFDGSGGGQWTITFKNNGGQIPNISHMTVYVREGTSTTSQTSQTSITAPEPGSSTLALLGLGLLFGGFVQRRRARR